MDMDLAEQDQPEQVVNDSEGSIRKKYANGTRFSG